MGYNRYSNCCDVDEAMARDLQRLVKGIRKPIVEIKWKGPKIFEARERANLSQ